MPDLACAAAAARTTPLAPIRPAISISTRVIRLLTLPQFGECPAFMSTRPNGYPGRKGDTRSNLIAGNVPFVDNVRLRSESDQSAALPRSVAMCQDVWPGRAVQDGLPRQTNVRAASMYQTSEVEQFAPGHHGYPRAPKTR